MSTDRHPYRNALRADRPDTVVLVGPARVAIGGDSVALIAGPCAVEDRDQLLGIARGLRSQGVQLLRGGAFKPRTSPHSFQGLGREGLEILAEARDLT
ncbi:MAG: aroF, partial [Thermoleophilia bacterium]|nr:aroF [Thermoleophilia bacterium]